MARPDSTSQARSPPVSWARSPWEPTRKTIPQANTSTTPVRRAVARWEGTDWMPILAKIAVIPAKKAEPTANSSQDMALSPFRV